MQAELKRLEAKRRRQGRLNAADMARLWELRELATTDKVGA